MVRKSYFQQTSVHYNCIIRRVQIPNLVDTLMVPQQSLYVHGVRFISVIINVVSLLQFNFEPTV